MKNATWVVVANGTQAWMYAWSAPGGPLHEIDALLNPANRMPEHELGHHEPGHTLAGRAGLAPRSTGRENNRLRFARRIAHILEENRLRGHFEQLVVAASNPFLGELLAAFDTQTRDRVVSSHAVDLTDLPVGELHQWLLNHWLPG